MVIQLATNIQALPIKIYTDILNYSLDSSTHRYYQSVLKIILELGLEYLHLGSVYGLGQKNQTNLHTILQT